MSRTEANSSSSAMATQPGSDGAPRRSLSRRAFLQYAGIGGGVLLLAACAPSAPSASTGAAEAGGATTGAAAPAASAGQVEISFWTPGGSPPFCEGFNTIGKAFMQENPDIIVGETQCYTGQETYNEVLLSNIAAGTPPDSTILWDSPVAFAVRQAVEPLDALMETSQYSKVADWPPNVLASCQYEGKVYGLPATASTYGYYYNADLLASKGIPSKPEEFPKTWADLRALSKEFVTWNGDTLEQAGFMPWTDPVVTSVFSGANGGQFYDAAAKQYTIDSPQNIEMFQFLVDWIDEQYKGNWTAVQASGNWGMYPDTQGRPPMFAAGKLAGGTEGFWYAGDFYTNDPQFKNWQVADIPVGPSGSKAVSGYYPNWLVIPKGSKHPTEAFKFLDYISGQGVKTWFAVTPDLPASKAVPSLPAPQSLVDRRGQEYADQLTDYFRKQMDVAIPMWDSPIQGFANDQIDRASQAILAKSATPAQALGEAQSACQAELDKALKGGA